MSAPAPNPSSSEPTNVTCSTEWKNDSKRGVLGGRNKCTIDISSDGKLSVKVIHQSWFGRMVSRLRNDQPSVIAEYKIENTHLFPQIIKDTQFIYFEKKQIESLFDEFNTSKDMGIKSLSSRIKAHTTSLNLRMDREAKKTAKDQTSRTAALGSSLLETAPPQSKTAAEQAQEKLNTLLKPYVGSSYTIIQNKGKDPQIRFTLNDPRNANELGKMLRIPMLKGLKQTSSQKDGKTLLTLTFDQSGTALGYDMTKNREDAKALLTSL